MASLAERFWPKVRTGDECWLWTASVDCNGYGKIGAGGDQGKTLCAHRVAWELVFGSIPPGIEIDHICRVRRCVRPSHLRLTTHKQNNENRTGIRGVRRRKNGSWQARVKHNGKYVHIGTFATEAEAMEAAREMRNQLFTHNDADRAA